MDPVSRESTASRGCCMTTRFGHHVQFDVAGDIATSGDVAQPCGQVDGPLRADSLVPVTDYNPYRATGKFFGLVLETQLLDKWVFPLITKFAEDREIGYRSKRGYALHSSVMGGKVNGQKTAARRAASGNAIRIRQARLNQMVKNPGKTVVAFHDKVVVAGDLMAPATQS